MVVGDYQEEVDGSGDADEVGNIVEGRKFFFIPTVFKGPVIFVIFYVGSGLDLNLVGEGILGGYSIVGSVVAFGCGDDPPTFQEFRGDDGFTYRAQLFIMLGSQNYPFGFRQWLLG